MCMAIIRHVARRPASCRKPACWELSLADTRIAHHAPAAANPPHRPFPARCAARRPRVCLIRLSSCDTTSHMKSIPIRELHHETIRRLRQASSSEVFVTERGQLIAKIGPAAPPLSVVAAVRRGGESKNPRLLLPEIYGHSLRHLSGNLRMADRKRKLITVLSPPTRCHPDPERSEGEESALAFRGSKAGILASCRQLANFAKLGDRPATKPMSPIHFLSMQLDSIKGLLETNSLWCSSTPVEPKQRLRPTRPPLLLCGTFASLRD